jgi:hypothetical protein
LLSRTTIGENARVVRSQYRCCNGPNQTKGIDSRGANTLEAFLLRNSAQLAVDRRRIVTTFDDLAPLNIARIFTDSAPFKIVVILMYKRYVLLISIALKLYRLRRYFI